MNATPTEIAVNGTLRIGLTVAEVCQAFGKTPRSNPNFVPRLVEAGHLRQVRLSPRRVLITANSIIEYCGRMGLPVPRALDVAPTPRTRKAAAAVDNDKR